MVFGNKGERSGTGVCFTRDPSTGEPGLYGEFLANAQGEDVVSGIRTPEPLAAMQKRAPRGVRAAASRRCAGSSALPRRAGHRVHGRGADGSTCSRRARAKRTAAAALKSAVDMVEEGLIIARGRRRADRPGAARPAPAPDDRSERERRACRAGPERVARRRVRAGSSSTPTAAESVRRPART